MRRWTTCPGSLFGYGAQAGSEGSGKFRINRRPAPAWSGSAPGKIRSAPGTSPLPLSMSGGRDGDGPVRAVPRRQIGAERPPPPGLYPQPS